MLDFSRIGPLVLTFYMDIQKRNDVVKIFSSAFSVLSIIQLMQSFRPGAQLVDVLTNSFLSIWYLSIAHRDLFKISWRTILNHQLLAAALLLWRDENQSYVHLVPHVIMGLDAVLRHIILKYHEPSRHLLTDIDIKESSLAYRYDDYSRDFEPHAEQLINLDRINIPDEHKTLRVHQIYFEIDVPGTSNKSPQLVTIVESLK